MSVAREVLGQILNECNGNIAHTAAHLGRLRDQNGQRFGLGGRLYAGGARIASAETLPLPVIEPVLQLFLFDVGEFRPRLLKLLHGFVMSFTGGEREPERRIG